MKIRNLCKNKSVLSFSLAAIFGLAVASTIGVYTGPRGPDACSNVGDTCNDGTIFAGQTQDGSMLFTTPADAPDLLPWSTARASGNTTSNENVDSSNETMGSASQLSASEYCENLSTLGHDDWYLPSTDELKELFRHRRAIGGFHKSLRADSKGLSGIYWSSSKFSDGDQTGLFDTAYAGAQRFNDGQAGNYGASMRMSVRCVRAS